MFVPAPPTFVALDLETTGLSPRDDRIVEVGALRFDARGRDLGSFLSLVNPRCAVSARARAVHGIGDGDLAASDGAEVVLPAFLGWLDEVPGSILMAHNAGFDAGFLGRELDRIGHPRTDLAIVDTLPLARSLLPSSPNFRLDTLALFLGLDRDSAHRALDDSRRVRGLWLAMTGGVIPDPFPPSYPVGPRETPVPAGWGDLERAMTEGRRVLIQYAGGTRGASPREITPSAFLHCGGTTYVVALCHLDCLEKQFRLDRVLRLEVLGEGPAPLPP